MASARATAAKIPRNNILRRRGAKDATRSSSIVRTAVTGRSWSTDQTARSSVGTSEFGSTVVRTDRKSTRLNSSHSQISYAVFCLKKKKNTLNGTRHPYIVKRVKVKYMVPYSTTTPPSHPPIALSGALTYFTENTLGTRDVATLPP